MKKYEILQDQTKIINGVEVYRIKALRDVSPNVKKGQIGGYIQSEANLSHEGFSWVFGESVVLDCAHVGQHGQIGGETIIRDNARVSGLAYIVGNIQIKDNAHVTGHAIISGTVHIEDYAVVRGMAVVDGTISIFQNAFVGGNANLRGKTQVFGDAVLKSGYHQNKRIGGGFPKFNSNPVGAML